MKEMVQCNSEYTVMPKRMLSYVHYRHGEVDQATEPSEVHMITMHFER